MRFNCDDFEKIRPNFHCCDSCHEEFNSGEYQKLETYPQTKDGRTSEKHILFHCCGRDFEGFENLTRSDWARMIWNKRRERLI